MVIINLISSLLGERYLCDECGPLEIPEDYLIRGHAAMEKAGEINENAKTLKKNHGDGQ